MTHGDPSAEDGAPVMPRGRTRMKHIGAFSAAILFAPGATAQLAFAEDLPQKIGLAHRIYVLSKDAFNSSERRQSWVPTKRCVARA